MRSPSTDDDNAASALSEPDGNFPYVAAEATANFFFGAICNTCVKYLLLSALEPLESDTIAHVTFANISVVAVVPNDVLLSLVVACAATGESEP